MNYKKLINKIRLKQTNKQTNNNNKNLCNLNIFQIIFNTYVTLDHKTSHKGNFLNLRFIHLYII